jgi:hypothetical protein
MDETNRSSAKPIAQSYPRAQSVIRQALSLSVGELFRTLKMLSLMASPLHFPCWGFLSTPEAVHEVGTEMRGISLSPAFDCNDLAAAERAGTNLIT